MVLLLVPGWGRERCYGLVRDKEGVKSRDEKTRSALGSSSGHPWARWETSLSRLQCPWAVMTRVGDDDLTKEEPRLVI